MAKQLNVDMRFTADTAKAKQAITELQTAIQKLGYGTAPKDIVNPTQFEQASAAARELAYHLNNAYNAKTGNLDLSKLNTSLQQSGTSLTQLTANFKNAGTSGQQAFIKLANAIASADQPVITLNTHLSTMFTTIKNVARFQISSSIIHGFIGGIQSAYGYAQDLNSSLNNIRIVTGQSAEQMAKFAEQANKTARSLSATTLDYTNASLIYYQQGLSDSEVKARTDVTVKLANVSRQSAEEVSSQMTAIWNNFDNGAHSMEYFADVITALGATTASSSEEIATGLSKFAPVAGTIGLSYEKASAALAAIIANTRQSADTVGTGLRTIFSRFESLKLGETLEDGVDLNKYTKAMQTIGVNVLDANGKLRDMDSILDDIAARWEKLDNTQRTTFATTVGGVRQYTNLMALFENWDDVQKNMRTATGSEGTLQAQADIYAESWEAARDRVKAAAESLYDTLIDENFFIGVDKVIEHILVGTNKFLENFGGIKSILFTILSFTLSMVASKIGPAVQKVVQDIQIMTGGASKVYQKIQNELSGAIADEVSSGKYSATGKAELESSQQLLIAKTKLGAIIDKLSASEKMRAELAISGYQLEADEIKKLAIEVDNLTQKQKESAEAVQEARGLAQDKSDEINKYSATDFAGDSQHGVSVALASSMAKSQDFENIKQMALQAGEALENNLIQAFMQVDGASTQFGNNFKNIFETIKTTSQTDLEEAKNQLKDVQNLFVSLFDDSNLDGNQLKKAFQNAFNAEDADSFKQAVTGIGDAIASAKIPAKDLAKVLKNTFGASEKNIDNYVQALKEYQEAQEAVKKAEQNDLTAKQNLANATKKLQSAQAQLNAEVSKFSPEHTVGIMEGITKGAAGLGQVATLINSIKSAVTTLGDDSATAGEKMTACFMAISIGLPAAIGAINNLRIGFAAIPGIISAVSAAITSYTGILNTLNAVELASNMAKKLNNATDTKRVATMIATVAAKKGLIAAEQQGIVVENLEKLVKEKKNALTATDIIQTLLLANGKTGETVAHGNNAVAMLFEAAAAIAAETAMSPLLVLALLLTAALAALALIIIGVVSGITALSNAYNKDALAAEQAANAAKELSEAYNEAKDSYEALKSSIEQYQSAKDGIAELTVGTQEWRDAIREANEEAMNLINTYDEITSGDYSINKDTGLIEFNDGVLEKVQAAKADQVDKAFAASQMANARARVAQSQADLTQLKRDQHMSYWAGAAQGALVGGVAGSIMPGVGTAAGAIGGAALGLMTTGAINADRDARIDAAIEALTTGELAEQFKNKQLSDADLKAKLQIDDDNLIAAIKDLANTINHNSDQYEVAANLIAKTELSKEKYKDKNYDEAVIEIASEAYEKKYKAVYDEIMKKDNAITKWAGANNKDVKELWKRYQEATGTNYNLSSNAVQGFSGGQGSNSGRNYEYIDEKGAKKLVNIETMASAIAASEALKELGASAAQAATILNNIHIDENAGYSNNDIRNYIASGNFENSTAGSINAMRDAVEEADSTQAYLEKILGGADRLKALADLQGITVEDFVTNFENSLNAIDFSSIGQNLSAHAKAAFEIGQKNMENLTYKQQSNLASLYQTTFNELGQSGLDVLNGSVEQLSKNGKLDEFEAIASAFDWSSGSIADFKQQCVDAGIAVDALNLDPWIEGMIAARKEVENFATAASKYKKLHDIIDDIEIGDTITEEQYKDLGAGYEDYFVLMADGTYKLVGDAQTFYDAVNKQSLEGFVNNATQAYENKSKIESISSRYNLGELRGTAGTDVPGVGYKVNESKVNAQLDFLDTQGVSDTGIQEIKADVKAGKELNYEQVKYLAEAVQEASAGYKTWDDVLQQFDGDAEKAEEAIATSARTTEELSAYTREYNLSQDASIAGLKAIASQYEECHEELDDYNQTVKTYTKDSEQARAAQQRLWKAVRNQEWGKLTDEISDYVITLNSSSSSAEEIKKANKEIAKSFNKTFNTNITEDWVDDNKELFQEWANASEEEANDVAEKILDLAKIDSIKDMEPIDLSNKFKMPVDVFEGLKTKWKDVKSILEANPIKVDAYGNADMSQLVASLLEAGYTAEEVAGVLAAIGQTDVSLNGFDTGVLEHYDLTTQEGIEGFTKGLKSWKGNIDTASGQYPTVGGGSASADMTKINNTGSGGGGGGSSNKTHDTKERDGEDRYRPIKAKQEDKSRQIDQAREKAERIAGKARIDNLREENKLLGDNIKLQQQYINEINNYLAQDKSDMLSKFGAFGISFNFDENGVINNYDSIMDKMYAIYNEKANQELDEDTWNDFEEEWQAAIDALEQYIETRDLAEEETANLTDMINEQFDKLLEITATKLELNLEVNDQDLELLDHLITKLEDDAYKSAEAIALMGDKMGRELERATYYQNAINETLGAYGIYSMEQLASMSPEELKNLGITSDTIDNLKDWNSELLSITETLDDLRDEIVNRVIDGFDTLQDKVQESYDYFSHWNTVLEDYRDIVDLNMGALGGKESRALIKQIDDSLLKNSTNALRSSKQMYDTLVESRTEAQKKLEEAMAAGRIGDIKHYEDVLADIDGKIKESQEQWLSDWSDGLQKAQDILTRAVEDAVAEYDKLLSPVYGSLDYLNEAYDRGKEVDEDYVQDYEKLYQLNKLNRDLTKVLNDTDGVKNREQLIKLQEKINKLQKDKTKMSEYDLEVLRKEFEVQQARIALEEAANAKSTVRLQRDNEGNWGYVYTSDFEATEELQQSYEDKLHEYQQLNDEYMSEMSDKLMDLSQNARDRISEIWSDATLTQEEKEARIAEVMKWFNAQRNYIEEQMGHAIDNQAALTDRFYATYQNMQAEVRDTFAETVLSQTMNIEQLSEVTGLLTTGVASLVEAGRLASLEYLASMEEINEAAGTTMDELAGNISSAVDQITIASDANVDTITELSETVQTELLNSLDAAIEAEEKFAQQIAETTANVEAQAAALADALRILNDYSGALSSSEIGNPLDTLTQSEEKYGIDQPAYNENDWVLNKELEEIFDAVYDEIKSDASHSDFLEMYGAMNDWLTLLQTQAGSAMQGFGSIMSPYYQTPESETLEQQVHIEASFPGVTNSSEIEEAFENLVNKAAQFANRKRQG